MRIERIDVKDGQFGPYTVFSAGGDSYSAFGRHHATFSRFKVGDDVNFEWEQKGQYKRVTSVNGPGVSTSAGVSVPSPKSTGPSNPTPPNSGGYRKDPNEFNTMMATRYALDAMIGNQAGTPEEAVALIKKIYDGFQPKPPTPDKESL